MVHMVIHEKGDHANDFFVHSLLLGVFAEVATRPPNKRSFTCRSFVPVLLLKPSTRLLHRNVSIPDPDLARHPACLTDSTEEGHQGIVDYCSLRSSDYNNVKTGKANVSHGNVLQLRFRDYSILGQAQNKKKKKKSLPLVSSHQKKINHPSGVGVTAQLELTWMPYVSLMWVLMAVMPPGKHPKQQFSPYLFVV